MLRSILSISRQTLSRCLLQNRVAFSSKFNSAEIEVASEQIRDDTECAEDMLDLIETEDKETLSIHRMETLKLDQYPYYVEREWWKKGKRMTFWASWRQLRDVKRRELIQETGADRMRLKALKWNTVLPQVIRDEAAEELFNMPRYSHPRRILNMCQFTGRQRGKIKPYRLNRHIFRKLADHSQLSGVQRAMW